MSRIYPFALAALCALASGAAHADTFTVYVFDYDYSQNPPGGPYTLPTDPTIYVGDTVLWHVSEGFHTVTSVAGGPEFFDSDFVQTGDEFSHTYTNTGTFAYYCLYHGYDAGDSTAGGMAGVVTVADAPPPVCPADLGTQGGVAGHDGLLDNNDFVVYIEYFFNNNPLADVGIQGGVAGTDNTWDNNDFIVYIELFFQGCT